MRRRLASCALVAGTVVAGTVVAALPATSWGVELAQARPGRIEAAMATPAGPFPSVAKSVVTIDAPLPPEVRGAPEACQHLRYYRYRAVDGPRDAQRADAVFVAMPGVLAGAGSLEMQALEVVQDATHVRSLEGQQRLLDW